MPEDSNTPTAQQLFEQIKLGSLDRVRELLTSHPELAKATSSDGRTALHHAVRESSPDMVRLVMELCPAQSGIACADGSTPLHDAAREPAQRGGLDKINLLLAGNPQLASKQDRYGETPLHIAARAATPDSFNAIAAIAPDAANIRNVSGRTPRELLAPGSTAPALTPEQLAVTRVIPAVGSQSPATSPAVAYNPDIPAQPRQPASAEPPADISTVGNSFVDNVRQQGGAFVDNVRGRANSSGVGNWLSENKFGLIAAGIAAALGLGTGMGTIGTMLIGTLAAGAANIFLDGSKSTLGKLAQPLLARAGINIGRGVGGNDLQVPPPDTQLPQAQRLDNLMVALLESRNGIMIGERHDHPAFRDSVREMLPRLKASGLQTLSIEIPQEMADQMIRAGSTEEYLRNNPDISRITGGEGTGRSICDLVRSAHACGIKVLGHEVPREQLVEAVMARAKSVGDRLEQLGNTDPEVRRLVSAISSEDPSSREANAMRLGEHLHRTGQRELLYDMYSLSRFSISEDGFNLRNEHAARYIEQNRTGKTIVIGGAYHTGRVLTDQRQQFYDALDRGYPPVLDDSGRNGAVPTRPHLGLDVRLGYPSIDIRGTSGGRIQFEQPQPHMIGQTERANGRDSDYEVHLPRDLRELPQSPFASSAPPVVAPQGLPPAPSSPAGGRPSTGIQ